MSAAKDLKDCDHTICLHLRSNEQRTGCVCVWRWGINKLNWVDGIPESGIRAIKKQKRRIKNCGTQLRSPGGLSGVHVESASLPVAPSCYRQDNLFKEWATKGGFKRGICGLQRIYTKVKSREICVFICFSLSRIAEHSLICPFAFLDTYQDLCPYWVHGVWKPWLHPPTTAWVKIVPALWPWRLVLK